jgi:hypothetical protein
MLFTDLSLVTVPGHAGFVAGRYRDGAFSDEWTDVARCAPRTFTAWAPACICGWRGCTVSTEQADVARCRQMWEQHLQELGAAARTGAERATA